MYINIETHQKKTPPSKVTQNPICICVLLCMKEIRDKHINILLVFTWKPTHIMYIQFNALANEHVLTMRLKCPKVLLSTETWFYYYTRIFCRRLRRRRYYCRQWWWRQRRRIHFSLKKKCQSLWSFYFQAPGIFNVKHSKGDDENIRFSTSGFFAVHLFFVPFGNWVAEWLISDCQIIIFFSILNTRVLGHLDYSKSGGSSVISREICWTDCNVASKCQTKRWEAIIHSFRR